MLRLNEITKDYVVADAKVHALKGVSISFRKSEFVSVLGPSGCGKTTLLNIIGGLDHYTSGELFINGVSTKGYGDRDWDTYRNHSIGFVFQSYNLIPHQTISENVELALTISGVDKTERVRRAHEALDKVGLKDQYNKKPNQLSGGQCQRVAIARALVNEPEILLADEPTGALDTVTSVQIMELIREIAQERLVIMVTHNPELAEQYSTRIVRLLDGNIVSDSRPYTEEEETAEQTVAPQEEEQTQQSIADDTTEENTPKTTKKSTIKKSKLSFWSAFRLSARNLMSKFKRTFLVCLAGSIGIIGVATVLAVSSGVQNYIHNMQNDMLSGNPITVDEETFDLNAMMSMNMMDSAGAIKDSVEEGKINVNKLVESLVKRNNEMVSFRVSNDITQEYVDFVEKMPTEYYAAITKTYGLNLSNNLYTDFTLESEDGEETRNMSLSAAISMYTSMLEKTEYSEFAAYITMFTQNFAQAPDNKDFILSQYDILGNDPSGHIATQANEIMVVVSDETELTDIMLAQYGYTTQKEFFNSVYESMGKEEKYDENVPVKEKYTYEELLGKKFVWYPNDTVFNKTPESSPTASAVPFTYNPEVKDTWTTGKELTVTAILRPKQDTSYGCLSSGIYYTAALAKEVLDSSEHSQITEYLRGQKNPTFTSGIVKVDINGTAYEVPTGITYALSYYFSGNAYNNEVHFAGGESQFGALLGLMGNNMGSMGSGLSDLASQKMYTLSLRELGGNKLPNQIAIYPTDFNYKDQVKSYLATWNDVEGHDEIVVTDNLEIVINMVNTLINIVTSALVAFTALSLVVSTVMIAIITYVSVIERVKEIGVIRSLGGRKRDVSNLFNAETFIIGSVSGVIGIAVTYLISGLINLIIGSLFGIYTLAALPIYQAAIMIAISIILTLISGLVPARLAAKKDPVDALRTE